MSTQGVWLNENRPRLIFRRTKNGATQRITPRGFTLAIRFVGRGKPQNAKNQPVRAGCESVRCLAAPVGFEPTTNRLTVDDSTAELQGNVVIFSEALRLRASETDLLRLSTRLRQAFLKHPRRPLTESPRNRSVSPFFSIPRDEEREAVLASCWTHSAVPSPLTLAGHSRALTRYEALPTNTNQACGPFSALIPEGQGLDTLLSITGSDFAFLE